MFIEVTVIGGATELINTDYVVRVQRTPHPDCGAVLVMHDGTDYLRKSLEYLERQFARDGFTSAPDKFGEEVPMHVRMEVTE